MLLYGNLSKSQRWPQICIFISFYWSLKARTQVTFVWILPIKLVGKKIALFLVSSKGVFVIHLFKEHFPSTYKRLLLELKLVLSSKPGSSESAMRARCFHIHTWSEGRNDVLGKIAFIRDRSTGRLQTEVGSMMLLTEYTRRQSIFRCSWIEKGSGNDSIEGK